METIRILLFDLIPHTGLGKELNTLLVSNLPSAFQPIHHQFTGQDMAQALKEFSAILARYSPQASFLVFAPAIISDVRGLCRCFYQTVQPEASLTAVVNTATCEDVVQLFHSGISDILIPPVRPIEILPRVLRFADPSKPGAISIRTKKEGQSLRPMIGESKIFWEQIKQIPSIAQTEFSVLITGESGTGKDICARTIHQLSPRSRKPFVPVNCGTMQPDLLENELFGHEMGAFTGAVSSAAGLIKSANGGTLFLDEVALLPPSAQAKLLRFIEGKETKALGSTKIEIVDVRIIAATNANLEVAVRLGQFRHDLFHRLNAITLKMPLLRERGKDVVLLAQHFLPTLASKCKKEVYGFTNAAQQKLLCYLWPGNVRELQHIIQRAIVNAQRDLIQAGDIHLPIEPAVPSAGTARAFKAHVEMDERAWLAQLLLDNDGIPEKAALAAHMPRRTFYRRLTKYQIIFPHYTSSD